MLSRIIRANSEELKNVLSFNFEIAEAPEVPSKAGETFPPPHDHPPLTTTENLHDLEDAVLSSAQQQADAILQEAQLKAAEIEKEAYEIGFSQGEKAGKEVGEKMVEALLKQYSQTLEALANLRKEIFSASEREVIRLSLEIARKVVKREVTIDEEVIMALVKVALNRLGEESVMTLRVNPRDCQSILRYSSSQGKANPLHAGIKLVEDVMISRGGCLIETEAGIIDARIEEQFREIEKGFFE
jgi:flagellar assembly protein FliH